MRAQGPNAQCKDYYDLSSALQLMVFSNKERLLDLICVQQTRKDSKKLKELEHVKSTSQAQRSWQTIIIQFITVFSYLEIINH